MVHDDARTTPDERALLRVSFCRPMTRWCIELRLATALGNTWRSGRCEPRAWPAIWVSIPGFLNGLADAPAAAASRPSDQTSVGFWVPSSRPSCWCQCKMRAPAPRSPSLFGRSPSPAPPSVGPLALTRPVLCLVRCFARAGHPLLPRTTFCG